MSKLLANQISNYNDNGPVEAKDGINVANGKPLQVAGANGTSGQFLKSTGSSVAWEDFPSIPAAQVNVDWNATSGVAQISNKPTLHAVATSGQYSDLSGLPSIPAAQIQSDWNTSNTASVDFIKNKPNLFSGAYADLTGKPTIPTNLSDLSNVSSTAPNNNEVLKWNGSNWAPATDATGGGGSDTNTTYSISCADGDNADEERIWLTAGGSGSGIDEIILEAGTGLSIARSGDKITFTNTVTDTDTNTNDYLSSASLSGNTLTLGRTGSQSLADLTVDLSSLGGGATVTTDDSAPGSPNDGDLWWKSDEGRLKVYYQDADSSQWVDASPPSILDLTAFTGHILPATHDQQDIGSATKKIRDLYLGSNSLHLGSVDVSESGGKLVLPAVEMTGHFIPDTNAAYDLGNAEYKIRHLFLSDNTVYFQGNFLKVAQHDAGGSAQAASYLIPLSKLKDALNASGDYEAFKAAIIAIADA